MADLGCWPGGWLQVAAAAVGPRGRVVGIDRAAVEPLEVHANAVALLGDLEDPATAPRIREELGGLADVVLSDAAPRLTGIRATDRAREGALLEAVERLLPELLRPGGDLLVKLLDSPEAEAAAGHLARRFGKARRLRTEATRKGSSERYLLARGYAGPSTSAS